MQSVARVCQRQLSYWFIFVFYVYDNFGENPLISASVRVHTDGQRQTGFYTHGASNARVLAVIVCMSVCVSVCRTPVL